jgi:hypothetical protein
LFAALALLFQAVIGARHHDAIANTLMAGTASALDAAASAPVPGAPALDGDCDICLALGAVGKPIPTAPVAWPGPPLRSLPSSSIFADRLRDAISVCFRSRAPPGSDSTVML